MSLQVKLRHPLGEKLVELEPRTSDDPVVIGRQVGAQIQVPSVSVSPRHSVMFVYEGRWVVQDSGETTGTFVNGQPIEGAVFLRVGDVIKLGAEPRSPTILIDPQGAAEGRTGYAMSGSGPARTVSAPQPRAAAAAARPVGGGYAAPAGYAPPAGYAQPRSPYGAAAIATPVAQPVADAGNGDDIAWPTEGSVNSGTGTRSAFTRPKKSSSSGGPIAIAIVVGIVIIIGTVWAVYVRMHPAPPPTVAVAPKLQKAEEHHAPVKDNSHGRGSTMFEGITDGVGPNSGVAPPTAKALPTIGGNPVEIAVAFGPGKRSTASLPIPKSSSSAGIDDSGKPAAPVIDEDDPRFKTKDWERLDQLRYSPAYLEALLAYEKYEVDHPSQLTAQVNLLREVTLDRLWFARIDTLFKKRDEITSKMKDYDQQIADEPNEVFRKNTLLPEKQALQKKLNAVNDLLVKEMGYTATNAPDPDDDAQLEELRKLRDRDYYAQWKKRVVNSVHKQRLLPWVD